MKPTFDEVHNNHDFRRGARESEVHPTDEACKRVRDAYAAFARGEITTIPELIDRMMGGKTPESQKGK